MSIWNKELKNFANLPEDVMISLNEGNTEVTQLKDNQIELLIKREDKNPSGSWKDRASALKLSQLLSSKVDSAVISSSGNAVISLLKYISEKKLNIKLHIVVSTTVNADKLALIKNSIENSEHKLYIEENPKQKSVQLSAELKIPYLKSSTDDTILPAYWSLGSELTSLLNKEQSNKEVGIFCPVSSGTAFVGMAQGIFIKLEQEFLMPRLFVCQTSKAHPIVNQLSEPLLEASQSLADAIIDKTGFRAPQIIKIIKETEGDVFSISDEELMNAKMFIRNKGVEGLSYNSLLSIAGYLKVKDKYNFKKVVCIASGR